MINHQLFRILLFLALSLILLQLVSGVWLFSEKFGLTPSSLIAYFAGDEQKFISAKSVEGVLETAVPHFLAISTTIFVSAHFLLFTQIISEHKKYLLIASIFIAALVDIFSSFGILYGYHLFAYAKLIGFYTFELLMALLLFILFKAALHSPSSH